MKDEPNNESPGNSPDQPAPEQPAQGEKPSDKPDASISATQHIENLREVYDQQNINKVDVYFSTGGQEADKIDFMVLPLTPRTDSRLPIDQITHQQFGESRMMLISHGLNHDVLAAEAVEQIVLRHCPGSSSAVCCNLQLQSAFQLSRLIREFSTSPLYQPGKTQALVIFENRETKDTASLLADFVKKGGPAKGLTEQLAQKGLLLIYAGQHANLPENAVQQEIYAAYYLINTLILGISEHVNNYQEALETYRQVIETSRLTGWLSTRPESDLVREVTALLVAGSLLQELTERRNSISYAEERETVKKLLDTPLKNIVLFIATYFDEISITDFDQLVKTLIGDLPETLINQQKGGAFDLLWEWETSADSILTDCGLLFDLSEKRKIPAYRFEKSVRKDILRDFFSSSQRLMLLRRHDVIMRGLFADNAMFTPGIVAGCLGLNFENAAINPPHYLAGFCLHMTDHLSDIDSDNWRTKQDYFLWLVNFIRAWEDKERFKSYLGQFYKQMMENELRRAILGALLTHLCTPDRPENLARLKTFLEGTSSEEMTGSFRIIRAIVFNYLDHLPEFFREVDSWTDTSTGEPSKSCAFIKIACTYIFYNGWLDKRGKRSLAVQLLEKAASPDFPDGLSLLSDFIFGLSSAAAFRRIYRKLYKENYLQERLLKEDMEADLQLIWVIVLTQWHYLLQPGREVLQISPESQQNRFFPALEAILASHTRSRLNIAFNKAIEIINYRIAGFKEADQVARGPLENKRTSARTLISLLATYSTAHGNDR
ncbi:hypothetical protein ACFFGT_32305 [Mucilaginibacter angelicae]|uniref:Uncharacterized protein n=1 Tax=Mucilaginibacter angelicae TaxID=869718 RepID=A0ABV6LHH5_9SPHI